MFQIRSCTYYGRAARGLLGDDSSGRASISSASSETAFSNARANSYILCGAAFLAFLANDLACLAVISITSQGRFTSIRSKNRAVLQNRGSIDRPGNTPLADHHQNHRMSPVGIGLRPFAGTPILILQ